MRRAPRTFHLQRYFSITSGVALLIASLALGWAYYREEVSSQIAAAEMRNVMLARSFANAVWPLPEFDPAEARRGASRRCDPADSWSRLGLQPRHPDYRASLRELVTRLI